MLLRSLPEPREPVTAHDQDIFNTAVGELAAQRDEVLAQKLALEIKLETTRNDLDACRGSRPPDLDRTDAAVGKIIRDTFRAIVEAEREAAGEGDGTSSTSG